MKVIFISSGNTQNGISPIVSNQGESLKKEEVEIDFFTIQGRGAKGYIKSIFRLRSYLKNSNYDVVHAHYWISGIVTSFAGAKNIVVSLMGDDVKAKRWFRWIIYLFYRLSWSKTIVKSKDMYETFGQKDVSIIPNGIDMNRFKPIDRDIALKVTQWNIEKKHILFTSNPNRVEKNFKLAKDAITYIGNQEIELHYLVDIPNEQIPYYYNSADVVILTSLWEGSPNAIKETMACNVPIVSTNVGDVKDIINRTEGCFISSFEYKEFASKIEKALKYNKRTNGREAIVHLKSDVIAKKIVNIYNDIVKEKKCVE